MGWTNWLGGMPTVDRGRHIFHENWDLDRPPALAFPSALPENLLTELKAHSVSIGSGLGAAVNRQRDLGMTRARGASGMGTRTASKRAIRRRMMSTLDNLIALSRAKNAALEMEKVNSAMKLVSQRQAMLANWAKRMKALEFETAVTKAKIHQGKRAAMDRTTMALSTTALQAALPFLNTGKGPAGAIVGEGVGAASMLDTPSADMMTEVLPPVKAWRTKGDKAGYQLDFPGLYMREPTQALANMAEMDDLGLEGYDLWRSMNPRAKRYTGILDFRL